MGYAAFTASCAESHWLSVKPSTHVAATPPEAKPIIYSSRTESQRISAREAKPQVAVIFSKPDREPKYGASQGSVKEKPVLVVIHAQMTVTANQ